MDMDSLGNKTTEERTLQVWCELEGLDRVTRNIIDVLNRLENKLGPILREVSSSIPETPKDAQEMKRVPLAAELNSLYCQADMIYDRIGDILDRVEV